MDLAELTPDMIGDTTIFANVLNSLGNSYDSLERGIARLVAQEFLDNDELAWSSHPYYLPEVPGSPEDVRGSACLILPGPHEVPVNSVVRITHVTGGGFHSEYQPDDYKAGLAVLFRCVRDDVNIPGIPLDRDVARDNRWWLEDTTWNPILTLENKHKVLGMVPIIGYGQSVEFLYTRDHENNPTVRVIDSSGAISLAILSGTAPVVP
jgi:hypothetical protein